MTCMLVTSPTSSFAVWWDTVVLGVRRRSFARCTAFDRTRRRQRTSNGFGMYCNNEASSTFTVCFGAPAQGLTPLMTACYNGNSDVINYMLVSGVNVNAQVEVILKILISSQVTLGTCVVWQDGTSLRL
jgi:hypothetical protein